MTPTPPSREDELHGEVMDLLIEIKTLLDDLQAEVRAKDKDPDE